MIHSPRVQEEDAENRYAYGRAAGHRALHKATQSRADADQWHLKSSLCSAHLAGYLVRDRVCLEKGLFLCFLQCRHLRLAVSYIQLNNGYKDYIII